ncbi:Hypothetical predicted protein [Olea europaea subsp. europaea]|uniref:DUF1985 domain-containing protein n=1 Tax=Olea europaea subsp. europaea TaxID=158383 RepID=A0A8S0SBG6_OLEEU|nr:Hypothetical predicted protein [Olea europaea subsp. europaea]
MHLAGQMEFEFLISKDAWLRAHISQRSNLKYMKTVMDHFDERQREDFRNSSLRYLAEVPDIQFSVQLIQQLVFRSVRTEKVHELWFNVQGYLVRFGLQEYALVTGLRCGLFPESLGVRGDFGDWGMLRLIHRTPIVELGRQDLDDTVSSGGSGEDETSSDDDGNGQFESDRDDDDNEDCDGDDSEDTECTRLREFIAGMVAPPAPTTATIMIGANVEIGISGSLPQDKAYSAPCPNEEKLPVRTEYLADIAPCPDDDHEPLPTPIDNQQDGVATEPSYAAGVSDAELDGCNVTNGEGKFIACVTSAYDMYA